MNKALRNPLLYVLFVLPAFVLFLAFFIYPIFTAINHSFTSWNGISKNLSYIGLDNYAWPCMIKLFGNRCATTRISSCFPA